VGFCPVPSWSGCPSLRVFSVYDFIRPDRAVAFGGGSLRPRPAPFLASKCRNQILDWCNASPPVLIGLPTSRAFPSAGDVASFSLLFSPLNLFPHEHLILSETGFIAITIEKAHSLLFGLFPLGSFSPTPLHLNSILVTGWLLILYVFDSGQFLPSSRTLPAGLALRAARRNSDGALDFRSSGTPLFC